MAVPRDCADYERRFADVGWAAREPGRAAIEDEPGPGGPEVVQLLEEADDIVDAVVPQTLAEVQKSEHAKGGGHSGPGDRGRRRWPWRRR